MSTLPDSLPDGARELPSMPARLQVEDLHVEFSTRRGPVPVLSGVSLDLRPRERVALVGESGSGKSVTALAIMGLLSRNGWVSGGSVTYAGHDLTLLPEKEYRKVRGREIALIFQDPTGSLDPLRTVGSQVAEAIVTATGHRKSDLRDQVVQALHQMQIPDPERRAGQYPHELSGGMNQRVMIAIALAGGPGILIADEPTTALDATTAAGIMDLLGTLAHDRDMSVLLITHDLGVVADFAERVELMYAGRIVERGPVNDIFYRPRHPYTIGLLGSVPDVSGQRVVKAIRGSIPSLTALPTGCVFHPRCDRMQERHTCREQAPDLALISGSDQRVACHFSDEADREHAAGPRQELAEPETSRSADTDPATHPLVEVDDISVVFHLKQGLFRSGGQVTAVDRVSFDIERGETLALVGESGSGKSTTARVVLGLQAPTSGRVVFDGVDLTTGDKRFPKGVRRRVQAVFQDPTSSLDPRMLVLDIVTEPLVVHDLGSPAERRQRAEEMLDLVGLHPEHLERKPAEFSGGQRQRIAIARALIVEPDLIVCDEPVTALDVSVQAQVLLMFERIKAHRNVSLLFIAHDLAVVRQIADRVAVIYLGEIVESGPADEVFTRPRHPYTRALLSAIPVADPRRGRDRDRIILEGSTPSALAPPSGCRFHTRCWKAEDICHTDPPALAPHGPALAACHFPEEGPVHMATPGGGSR
ncbi:MAG: dipeptide ABC transporter ATP-binding protein [Actinobacteria bacterium]|nr:dipeptide ABC transporter ATP-binding protein [Actinomycetota bacterium]